LSRFGRNYFLANVIKDHSHIQRQSPLHRLTQTRPQIQNHKLGTALAMGGL
jgi:hypothetical protein